MDNRPVTESIPLRRHIRDLCSLRLFLPALLAALLVFCASPALAAVVTADPPMWSTSEYDSLDDAFNTFNHIHEMEQ